MSEESGEGPAQASIAARIGFIGLGRMGYPMAGHLAASGARLTVFDIRADAAARFAKDHQADVAGSISEVAGASDVVILMLPRSDDVEAVVAGTAGLAETMAAGSLVIDCSTSDPAVTQALGKRLGEKGIALVDSPVAGGVVFAENATLDVLMGGEAEAIARAQTIVSAFGKNCLVCGGPGAGHAMKLINNFVNANALVTYSEALSVGARFGIGIETMMSGLAAATTGRNHPLEKKIGRQVLSRQFASGMALALIAKDVGLARKMAETLEVDAPLMALCHDIWKRGETEIGGDVDQTEIARLWERAAGVKLESEPPDSS